MKMMMRWFTALGAFFVVAICVAACGSSSSVSSSEVANVAGNGISVQAFNHWMYVAEKGNAVQDGGPVIVPTDPPQFTGCIKQVRAQIPTYAKTPAATLKTDCKELFTELSGQVMDFLIKAYWYQGTAYRDHITVSKADLAKAFKAAQKSTFPTTTEYKAFLTETGETLQDIDFRLRVNTVYQKLIAKHVPKVTTAAEMAYFTAHASQFGTAETRSIKLIQTADTAAGKQAITAAKAALSSGQSFAKVAAKYSTDPTSKAKGGVLAGVTQNEKEAAVNTVIFRSPVGKLEGPIKGEFGYYLVEVTHVTPAVKDSFTKEQAQIKELLTQQFQSKATTVVNTAAKKAWGARTKCRALYAMADCAGYVAPKTTTSPTAPGTTTASQSGTVASTQTPTTPASTATTPAATATTG